MTPLLKAYEACVPDTKDMRHFLMRQYGYPPNSILMLTDDQKNAQFRPTKRNIEGAIRWLTQGNALHRFFYFDGHGGRSATKGWHPIAGSQICEVPALE